MRKLEQLVSSQSAAKPKEVIAPKNPKASLKNYVTKGKINFAF